MSFVIHVTLRHIVHTCSNKGKCSVHGGDKNAYRILPANPKKTYRFGDLGIDGRIIFKKF
jgi:hypothetical protein